MANPNIVNVSDIRGKTHFNELSTSYGTMVNNAAGSNSVYKINVISISNATGATRTINIAVYRDPDGAGVGVSARYYDIANTVSIPNNSTLVVTSKDTSFYLEEEDILVGSCSAAGCEVMVSYEIIS